MLNDRLSAAQQVAEKLFALETAIDDALICAGELSAALPLARKKAKLSATVGQEAFTSTSQALNALFTAREKLVDTHNSLAVVHKQIGLKTFATGDLWKLASLETEEEEHNVHGIRAA